MGKQIGVDLGTANTLIYCKGKGILLNEPSVVAIHRESGAVLAVGHAAKSMIGRTPDEILVVRPMRNGVIADLEIAQAMLKAFLEKANPGGVVRPLVTVCVPHGITEVERRAALETILRAGGKNGYIIEEPMAAALGADLPVREATGSMVVDIGGGTCQVAVVSFGGIVASSAAFAAGEKMDGDIVSYMKRVHNVLIGMSTAEEIKVAVGCAYPSQREETISVMGRDLATGLPRMVCVTSKEVQQALAPTVEAIVEAVQSTLEQTPPELAADIVERGIVLTGGGARLSGLAKQITDKTGIPSFVAENAEECAVMGTGLAFWDTVPHTPFGTSAKRFLFGHRQ